MAFQFFFRFSNTTSLTVPVFAVATTLLLVAALVSARPPS